MIAASLLAILLSAGSYWSIAPDGSVIEVLTNEAVASVAKLQPIFRAKRPAVANRFTLIRGRFFGRRR